MLVSPRRRPLTARVLWELEALQEPWHYLLLADVLHQPADKVLQACHSLAQQGLLRWCRRGVYMITKRGIAASRGALG